MKIALLIIFSPLIFTMSILRFIRNTIYYFIYRLWIIRKRNEVLMRHGVEAMNLYRRLTARTYSEFVGFNG